MYIYNTGLSMQQAISAYQKSPRRPLGCGQNTFYLSVTVLTSIQKLLLVQNLYLLLLLLLDMFWISIIIACNDYPSSLSKANNTDKYFGLDNSVHYLLIWITIYYYIFIYVCILIRNKSLWICSYKGVTILMHIIRLVLT